MIHWRLGVFGGACSVGNKLTGARQTEGVCFVELLEHRVRREQKRSVDVEHVENVFKGDDVCEDSTTYASLTYRKFRRTPSFA